MRKPAGHAAKEDKGDGLHNNSAVINQIKVFPKDSESNDSGGCFLLLRFG